MRHIEFCAGYTLQYTSRCSKWRRLYYRWLLLPVYSGCLNVDLWSRLVWRTLAQSKARQTRSSRTSVFWDRLNQPVTSKTWIGEGGDFGLIPKLIFCFGCWTYPQSDCIWKGESINCRSLAWTDMELTSHFETRTSTHIHFSLPALLLSDPVRSRIQIFGHTYACIDHTLFFRCSSHTPNEWQHSRTSL